MFYPARTPLAQRSLPPDALDAAAPEHGLTTFGLVRPVPVPVPVLVLVRIVEPWFGQPGGALVFTVAAEGVVVRDLVARGDLQQLAVNP